MSTLKVNWLGDCPRCGSDRPHDVEIYHNTVRLGDAVICTSCHNTGRVSPRSSTGCVIWDNDARKACSNETSTAIIVGVAAFFLFAAVFVAVAVAIIEVSSC